ncbi:uncharacterized protein FTOL_10283 [Fusarium torulosum]|uniref:BTB domain-containing protein n=1 Tax=Fusarium torulosum TaxID=33205 RepID=A0AAE8SLW3_9HYPO|nr:uncharacterized protein FTOL_10283 [Fusarium torulosum]
MAPKTPNSGTVSIQEDLQSKKTSKKPSIYILDPNGDTQLVLSTHKDQPFIWKEETIFRKEARPSKKSLKLKKKEERRKNKKDASHPPPPPPPPARPESPLSTPTLLGQTTDSWSSFSSFSNVAYSRPDLSDEETVQPEFTDADKNADSPSLQEWDYGERPGLLPNHIEVRILVSGKHLELASPYFKKMFSGPYTEARADHSGLRRVTATDWDPEAFNIVLTIMHGYHRDVPKSLGLETLAKLAMIVDYYECHETIELHAGIWLERLKSEVPTVYGRDCVLYMFVSWVFSQQDMFAKMTQLALKFSRKLIDAGDIPIPLDLLKQIDLARQSYLETVFSATYDLLDILQEETPCSYECSSMLLGVLTKELKKHGILSPRTARPFYGCSVEGSEDMIKGLKMPQWCDRSGHGMYGYGHSCTIQQKLSPVLEKAGKELRVFDLQDFQLEKGHIRPPQECGDP